MGEASDAKLIKIVMIEHASYQSEALSAAENELASRNVSPEQVSAVKLEYEKDLQKQAKKASIPLDDAWKALTFLFPGVIFLVISGGFKSEGYERKASELARWTLFGVGFYIALILLLNIVT